MRGRYARKRARRALYLMTPPERRTALLLAYFKDSPAIVNAPQDSAMGQAADRQLAELVTDPAAWGLRP